MHQYDMLADGDRVAVGLSGGKDSLALLDLLAVRREYAPIDYQLEPVYIDPGFPGGFSDQLKAHCDARGLPFHVHRTDHGILAHRPENQASACFLCARLRRKALFEHCRDAGCNKLALGHHKDDIIETFFLNLCYAGHISTMVPSQTLFDGALTVIRPLAFLDESAIETYSRQQAFPICENPCPSAGRSKRQEIKALLSELYAKSPHVKGNIFHSLQHVRSDYLL